MGWAASLLPAGDGVAGDLGERGGIGGHDSILKRWGCADAADTSDGAPQQIHSRKRKSLCQGNFGALHQEVPGAVQ